MNHAALLARFSVAIVIAFAIPAGARAQAANSNTITGKCLDANGKPCTAAQVRDLGHGIATGRRMYQPLAMVKSVEPGGADGALKCVQNDGSPCTAEQYEAINKIAAQQKCSINYNSSKSNSGNVRATDKQATSKTAK